MHPAVKQLMDSYESRTKKELWYRGTLNGLVAAFLENVAGPVFDYDFRGITLEHPFRDFNGKWRYGDVRYSDGIAKSIFELDGYTTHARDVTSERFDDHMERQNDLLLHGWFLLRFSSGMVIRKPEVCQRQLMQGLARWHYLRPGAFPVESGESWRTVRQTRIVRLALRNGGMVTPAEVARVFRVANQTAINWLRELCGQGMMDPERTGEGRVRSYRLRYEIKR